LYGGYEREREREREREEITSSYVDGFSSFKVTVIWDHFEKNCNKRKLSNEKKRNEPKGRKREKQHSNMIWCTRTTVLISQKRSGRRTRKST
jgi:hypothetical protein